MALMVDNTKYILHVCEHSAFLDATVKMFEEVNPQRNLFVCDNSYFPHKKFNYDNLDIIKELDFTEESIKIFLENEIENLSFAIFHNIRRPSRDYFLKHLYKKISIHANVWGWEIYDSLTLCTFLYQPRTLEKFIYIPFIANLKAKIIKNKGNKHLKILELVNSFSTILPNEVDFLRTHYQFRNQYLPYIYPVNYKIESTGFLVNKREILVGNSATPENNHLDLMSYLDIIINKIDKINVPLSYGKSEYSMVVKEYYHRAFGDKFKALDVFMPFSDYNLLVSRCSHVIMGHLRQQALGNITISLFNGAKVFMNKNSIAYKYLSMHGFVIYTLEELSKEIDTIEKEEIVIKNRTLLDEHFGIEKAKIHALDLILNYVGK